MSTSAAGVSAWNMGDCGLRCTSRNRHAGEPEVMPGTILNGKRRSAFTLIELLVVIAIIALLVSLLAPSLRVAKDLAKEAVCAAQLRHVGTSMILYADEYEKFPHYSSSFNPAYTWQLYNNRDDWKGFGLLFKMRLLNQPSLVYCPAMRVKLFTYPEGWLNAGKVSASWENMKLRVGGYLYRKFGHEAGNADLRLQDTPSTFALGADIFNIWWAPKFVVANPAWPHLSSYGINVVYADGHAELYEMGESEYLRTQFWCAGGGAGGDPDQETRDRDYYTVEFFEAMDIQTLRRLQDRFPY